MNYLHIILIVTFWMIDVVFVIVGVNIIFSSNAKQVPQYIFGILISLFICSIIATACLMAH